MVARPNPPPGPLHDLKALLYELYLEAGAPTLDELASKVAVAADRFDLPAQPGRDTIQRCLGSPEVPASQHDAAVIGTVLARMARWDEADVAARVRKSWVAARMAAALPPIGRAIDEDLDPFAFEVQPPIDAGVDLGQLAILPTYVVREHDQQLRSVVHQAAAGRSQLVVLVGNSSTGKTRACWEAINAPEALSDQWRLWHPIYPGQPEGLADALDKGRIPPNTVVWLNDIQHYLLAPAGGLGERVAAGLRELLRSPELGPVLVLGTVWPEYWAILTSGPAPGGPDSHPQARALLTGAGLRVPDTFSGPALAAVEAAAKDDPRLAEAYWRAEDGQIAQYLAGGPALLERYEHAPAAAKATITAAMDLRRLGHGPLLPRTLLEHAATGYLTPQQYEELPDGWLDTALAYAGRPCRGARGPLTAVRYTAPDPGDLAKAPTKRVGYRLAGYLDQHARAARSMISPPASLWKAGRYAHSGDEIYAIADAADARGRYRHAALLYLSAIEAHSSEAVLGLARLQRNVGNPAEARRWLKRAIKAGIARALSDLADMRLADGHLLGAVFLYRDAVKAGDARAWSKLAKLYIATGDPGNLKLAQALHYSAGLAGDARALFELGRLHGWLGDAKGAEELVRQAADAGDYLAQTTLGTTLELNDPAAAENMLKQALDAGNAYAAMGLMILMALRGDAQGAEALARRLLKQGNPVAMTQLAVDREEVGNLEAAEAFYQEIVDAGDTAVLSDHLQFEQSLENPDAARFARRAVNGIRANAYTSLARLRKKAGNLAQARELLQQALDAGGGEGALRGLARLLEETGDQANADALRRFGVDADGSIASPWWPPANSRRRRWRFTRGKPRR